MSSEPAKMKFLRLLVKREMTAAELGDQVWGKPARNPQAYVRPASRVLYRLRDDSLVTCRVTQDSRLTLWQATQMAVKYLDQIDREGQS